MIGTDIGGVWLSVQHIMPQFRVSFPKPASGPAVPFTVGPIPAELHPYTGPDPKGVVIVDCGGGTFCAENGLLEGDMVTKINSGDITDVASFEKTIESLPPTVLLSVRRVALKMTSARLIKIKYGATPAETQEGSSADETVDVEVLDVALPFAAALEKSRKTHQKFEPSAAELETLTKTWAELPANDPLLLMSGSNRLVAQANFDEALASDRALARSRLALILDMEGNALRGSGGKVIDVYGIEAIDAKAMEGNYVTVTMASAPFPINVEFSGRFRMTRIADWSDEDEKLRAQKKKGPAEDLSKFKTLPDVPPAKPQGTPQETPQVVPEEKK